jgi:hypothetical protein
MVKVITRSPERKKEWTKTYRKHSVSDPFAAYEFLTPHVRYQLRIAGARTCPGHGASRVAEETVEVKEERARGEGGG